MKKTPSALKWLAEKRARLAHDLQQTRQVAIDVNTRLATLEVDLASLDRTIAIYDPDIKPESIEAVAAHKGQKGGSLQEGVIGLLQKQAPEWVSTDTLELLICLELGLTFETSTLRKR